MQSMLRIQCTAAHVDNTRKGMPEVCENMQMNILSLYLIG